MSADDATYILSIELPSPIENILVQSDIPLEMLDVDSNTAVVSRSECDRNDGNMLLCCYRCQVNTNRVDLKFRTVEGQHGILRVYITPNIQPKCCQLRTYTIHPLSLHIMVHKYDTTRLITFTMMLKFFDNFFPIFGLELFLVIKLACDNFLTLSSSFSF